METIKKYSYSVLLLVACLLVSNNLFAPPFNPPPPPDVPLDGGFTLLIAGGIAYAGNEVRMYFKKK